MRLSGYWGVCASLAIVAVPAALLLFGFTPDSTESKQPRIDATSQPAVSIYEAAVAATVSIEVEGDVIGTGFVVESRGTKYVWTAGHCVPSQELCPQCGIVHTIRISKPVLCEGVEVGRIFAEVKVVRVDYEWDLALLEITSPFPVASTHFAYRPEVRIGDPIFTVGNALGDAYEYSLFFGHVSRLHDNGEPLWTHDLTRADITAMPGCSGAGVFNAEGKVIGILVGGLRGSDNLMLFVPVADIEAWARLNDLRFAVYQPLW